MLKKDRAVCLRNVDYSETSQIVTLFTKDSGKVPAIAKGSKRPKTKLEGPIEIFAFGDIVFAPPSSGKLATLTEFHQKPCFLKLPRKLFTLNCALFAAELLNALTTDSDPHPDLFDDFIQFLDDVDNCEDELTATALLILFQLVLLKHCGTKLLLSKCANCNSPFNRNWYNVHFSSSANGLLCPDCEQAFVDKIRLTKNCADCLADLKKIKTAPAQIVHEIEKVLVYHFTELMHKPPKMAKYFLKN